MKVRDELRRTSGVGYLLIGLNRGFQQMECYPAAWRRWIVDDDVARKPHGQGYGNVMRVVNVLQLRMQSP